MQTVAFFGSGPLARLCHDYLLALGSVRVSPGLAIPAAQIGLAVNYEHIIPAHIINGFPLGIINFHPAPLPQYRGRSVFAHAILNGETEWCVTAHYMTGVVDAGPVIDTEPVPILPDDTAFALYARARAALFVLFTLIARSACTHERRLWADAQDESKSQYYSKRSLAPFHDCTGLAGDELHRRVRALTFPGKPKPYIVVDGHKYELTLREDE